MGRPAGPSALATPPGVVTLSLDSDVAIDLMRGVHQGVRERFDAARLSGDRLVMSSIALHELVFGARRSARPETKMREIEALLAFVEPIEFGVDDGLMAGRVRADLANDGREIPTEDLLIGSQALARSWSLVSGNIRHLGRIPGLTFYDWRRSAAPLSVSDLIARLTGREKE